MVEGEGLGEGLANDVACFVWVEELRVKWDNLSSKGGALDREPGIESFQMKEDCLFGFLQFLCALAGNGDFYKVCWFHIECFFKTISVNLVVN